MARKLPKRYKPGELDAIRRKIGYVSPEEARQMTEILGGEIGIEKTEYDLQREKLQQNNSGDRKKNVDVIETVPDDSYQKFRMISSSANAIERELTIPPSKKNLSYPDRIKIDFLCSRPEYGIKTMAGAIGSLFSFIFPIPDNVNPTFINKLEKNIFKPVIDLVKATRVLYTKTRQEIYNEISSNKFHARILNTFKSWDVESLEQEIFHLRKKPRGQTMRNLLRLCKMFYYPVMQLSRLDETRHILAAYKWAYKVNIKSASTKPRDKERLISAYYDAEKNLSCVLQDIKKLLYPFLLKRVAVSFSTYDEFFITEQENILNFLGIYPHDMPVEEIPDVPGALPARKEKVAEEEPEIKENSEKTAADLSPSPPGLPEDVKKGIGCLEKLYPGAGWYNLSEFPDMYPYFQSVFNYPDGFKLIPPADPIHQVVILLSILNDLFYGFRHIKFGLLRNKDLEAYNIQGQVEGLISSWPLYIDELISKIYLSRLTDYSRQMEKDKTFKMSEVGKKIIAEMDWIKKNYLLPYFPIKMYSPVAGITKRQILRLSEVTRNTRELLSQVVAELKRKAETGARTRYESINNPWSPYVFDLENSTSKRLGKLLYTRTVDAQGHARIIDRRNNANLLFYSVSILSLLDYLINTKESHLYYAPGSKIFRNLHLENGNQQVPVPVTPTAAITEELAQNVRHLIEESREKQGNRSVQERLSLKEAIEQKITFNRKKGTIFSVVYLNFFENGTPDNTTINNHIQRDKDLVIPLAENTLLLLLDNRDTKNTILQMKKLIQEIGKEQLATGVIQFQLDWNFSYFLKILDKIKLFTARQGASKIVYLDLANNKFRSIVA